MSSVYMSIAKTVHPNIRTEVMGRINKLFNKPVYYHDPERPYDDNIIKKASVVVTVVLAFSSYATCRVSRGVYSEIIAAKREGIEHYVMVVNTSNTNKVYKVIDNTITAPYERDWKTNYGMLRLDAGHTIINTSSTLYPLEELLIIN